MKVSDTLTNSKKMLPSTFFRQLLLISIGTAFVLFLLHQFTPIGAFSDFSWISLTFFILLTLAMYGVGYFTAQSTSTTAFTGTILGFTFAKMALSLVVVVAYHKLAQPTSKIFVIPFFIVYLIYTAFETYFMSLLGKQKR